MEKKLCFFFYYTFFLFVVREWHTDKVLGKFCGRQGNTEPLILESNKLMKVKFTTDSSVNRTGFAATFQTGRFLWRFPLCSWFPPGLENRENLEKQEGIFQLGNFIKTGKVREFYSKYWKNLEKIILEN